MSVDGSASMPRGLSKRVVVSAALVVAAAAGTFWTYRSVGGGGQGGSGGQASAPPRFSDSPGGPGDPAQASPPEQSAQQQVERVMAMWRTAIQARDSDTVLACDGAFLGQPHTFLPALVESAQRDPDDRVRAFSTRVLGKLGDPSLTEVLRKLLADTNPYTRHNAAWALGQMAGIVGSEGPAMSPAVLRDLERVRREDRADFVRQAAAAALAKIQKPSSRRARG
jgi:HEAT repeats